MKLKHSFYDSARCLASDNNGSSSRCASKSSQFYSFSFGHTFLISTFKNLFFVLKYISLNINSFLEMANEGHKKANKPLMASFMKEPIEDKASLWVRND